MSRHTPYLGREPELMPRFVLGDERFDQLSSKSLYEADYERLLVTNARILFPEYYLIQFKPLIQSDTGAARPDLALVDRSLRLWWVVEVEMAHHPLKGHVLPQVSSLASGRYSLTEAQILHRAIPRLDPTEAIDLVKGTQPGVLVIVNERQPGWEKELSQIGAVLMIVEVFRSDRDIYALRANGAYPNTPEDFVSVCSVDPAIAGLLVVKSPARLGVSKGKDLWIEADGTITQWTRFDIQDKVWLKARGTNPLEGRSGPFKLSQYDDGRLLLS